MRPYPMPLEEIPSANSMLQLAIEVADISPGSLFDFWTRPELLMQWWPQQAEIVPQLHGDHHLSWPAMDWHLRGYYLIFNRPSLLSFTWKWDADVEVGERIVHLMFERLGHDGGTRLWLWHGMYANTPEDQKIREDDHLAGWRHFLPKLQAAVEVWNRQD